MNNRLNVIIPTTPELALRPNGRVHWATKAKAVNTARQQAGWSAKAACIDAGWPEFDPDQPTTVAYTIYWPPRAKGLDHDNAIASLKAFTDGIADILTEGNDGNYQITVAQDCTGRSGFIEAVISQ